MLVTTDVHIGTTPELIASLALSLGEWDLSDDRRAWALRELVAFVGDDVFLLRDARERCFEIAYDAPAAQLIRAIALLDAAYVWGSRAA